MLDRTQAPKAYLLEDLSLADVKIHHLDNKIKVHVFADDTNPVVKADFVFASGKRNEAISGAATICGKLLTEATLSYSSDILQETLDHYGAHLDVAVDYDDTTISLLCLKEHVSVLLPVVKSVMTEPLFDQKEFEKIKYQLSQRIKINNGKNNVLATKAIRSQLLAGSPYGEFASEESINKISIEDVKAYFQRHLTIAPQVVIAGQVDDTLFAELNNQFGILSLASHEKADDFQLTSSYKPTVIKRTGSVQASIRLGTLSIGKSHPDYYKLAIANEILGGYFGSRLMKNIREDKGYTYGIYSSISNYQAVDYHVIGADVQLENVDDAISEVKKELLVMQTDLVSEEELTTVKNYMLGNLASHLDNIFSQADNYKSKLVEGIDYKAYFTAYVESIRGISSNEILAISKKYFSQEYAEVKVV
jgi:predicted Zn-dependent peptidase